MASPHGYFKLYRNILDHRYFADAEKLRFWIWCLLRANHKTSKVIIGNETVLLEPGQFITGRKSGSEELKISEMTFRTLLRFFSEKEKKLTNKTTNKYTIVTVLEYNTYNFVENEVNQQINQQLTSNQPATNQQLTTDNNDKNVNNVKNDKKVTTLASIEKTTFDFSASKFVNLNGKIEKYKEKYPAVNVASEILKMEAWLMSNPKNRKSHYERFINNWLSRAQDKAPKHSEGETVDERHKRELEETKRRLGY